MKHVKNIQIDGNWCDVKAKLIDHYVKLSEQDLKDIDRDREKLIQAIHRRYGGAYQQVEHELDEFLERCGFPQNSGIMWGRW